MEKTAFHLKGTFPGEYITNVHVWDNSGIKHEPLYYHETASKGKIWIDDVEINAKRARQLRRGFCSNERWFTWGWFGHETRITSLSICLHLFKDEQIALNMYLPFMHQILGGLKRESFEITIELTDFITENIERMSRNFYTRYYDLGLFGNHEINFEKDRKTGIITADLLDQICTDLVNRQEKEYNRPSLKTFFGIKDPPKLEFDWTAAYQNRRQELSDLWFKPHNSIVRSKSLRMVMLETKICLQLYKETCMMQLDENSKEMREYIQKHRARKRQEGRDY